MIETLARWFRPVVYLSHNWITLLGAILTTSSAVTMVSFWALLILTSTVFPPYVGILFFLVLPGFFVAGLVLIPLGLWLQRRKLRRLGELPTIYPQVDLRDPFLRRTFGWVGGLTLANVLLLGTATYRGVEYMDSVRFCGETCHTVMQPEFTSHQNSPHERVACVDCHIGPGAEWFVRYKFSGLRQVYAVLADTYPRPIPTPVANLRPARQICEQCHWPQMFHGDKFVVKKKFSDDEANTPLTTVFILKIGGRTWQGRVGIHGRHLDEVERITYVATDRARDTIPVVRYIDDDGKTVEYSSDASGATPEEIAKAEVRTMDCMDCHNRPTHIYRMPEEAVDLAMDAGSISPKLPFVKQQAVALLRAEYSSREDAAAKIPAALLAHYQKSYPDVFARQRKQVETAAQQVKDIYLRNVFPKMNVNWGTYRSNIGHPDFAGGCFRCHDGSHVSSDGRTISNDCASCHTMLAMDEPQEPKILQELGGSWPITR